MKGKKLIKMINNKVKAIMTQSHKDDGDEIPTRMKLKSQTVQEYTWLPQAMLLPSYETYFIYLGKSRLSFQSEPSH